MTTNQHGGKRPNAGRKKEQGFTKLVSVRMFNEVEYQMVSMMTPRQRLEACLRYQREVLDRK